MIKFFHVLAAWLGLLSTIMFLFANIKDITEGVGYIYLAFLIFCGAFILVVRVNHKTSLSIRKSSTLWLLTFLTYFVTKAVLDFNDFNRVKAITAGTSGGLIFALGFGVAISIFFQSLAKAKQSILFDPFLALFFYLICIFLSLAAFREHVTFMRSDIFLIDNPDAVGKYQRAGIFTIMVSLVASVMLMELTVNQKKTKYKFIKKIFYKLTVVTYFILVISLLPTTQLIGSNTGFVVILGLGFSTAIWLLLQNSELFQKKIKQKIKKFSSIFILRKSAPAILIYSFWVCTALIIIGLLIFSYFKLEVAYFRIFGFSGENLGGNSLEGRMNILFSNFMIHFEYSPLFGHLRVDELTTGSGTYAHSLVSMISHLGIVGTVIFLGYLVNLYYDLKHNNLDMAEVKLFKMLSFCVILTFSLVGTFFTWMPLWFALGLLFSPLTFRTIYRSSKNYNSRFD